MVARKTKLKKIRNELKSDKLLLVEIIISIVVLIFVIILSIYAVITPRYRVVFNSNGGTSITSKLIKQNKTVGEPTPPIRDGYEFLGWYCDDQLYDFDNKITTNLELVAHWKEKDTEEQVKSISLNAEIFSMQPETSVVLPVSLEPKMDNGLYWESTDTDILTVDNNGHVIAKKEGKAIVRVTTKNNLTDEVEIIVDKKAVLVREIALEEREIVLEQGTKRQLNLIFYPQNVSNKNVIWKSDNTDVVSVSKTGEIVAKKPGEALIVVSSLDGEKMTNCKVVVIEL